MILVIGLSMPFAQKTVIVEHTLNMQLPKGVTISACNISINKLFAIVTMNETQFEEVDQKFRNGISYNQMDVPYVVLSDMLEEPLMPENSFLEIKGYSSYISGSPTVDAFLLKNINRDCCLYLFH